MLRSENIYQGSKSSIKVVILPNELLHLIFDRRVGKSGWPIRKAFRLAYRGGNLRCPNRCLLFNLV